MSSFAPSKRLEAITEMLCCCRNDTVCFSFKKKSTTLNKIHKPLYSNTSSDKILRILILSKKPPYSQNTTIALSSALPPVPFSVFFLLLFPASIPLSLFPSFTSFPIQNTGYRIQDNLLSSNYFFFKL